MLILTRRVGESIVVGDDIVLTVFEVRGDAVRIGIEAPRSVRVNRKEVYEEIQRSNEQAVSTSDDALDALRGAIDSDRPLKARSPTGRVTCLHRHPSAPSVRMGCERSMTRMPERGVDIELRDQQGNAHRSGVLESNRGRPAPWCSRRRPTVPPTGRSNPAPGCWSAGRRTTPTGCCRCCWSTLRASGPAPLLVVEVADDAWREERREYVRSSLDADVLIDFEAEDSEGDPGPGTYRPS